MRIDEGFSITVDINGLTTPLFWEVEVTPPGMTMGGHIDISGQRNTRYVTKAPRALIEIDDGSFTAGYDPAAIPQLRAIMGVNKKWTIHYPDTFSIDYFGWLETFRPTGAMSRGNRPLAQITFTVSNIDPATGLEAGPVDHTVP
jgi:hypothetical protein